ncbi:MAG: hypothetical protein ACXWYS_00955 [Gaiellaceae bacterium]
MFSPPRLPSPALVVACLALLVALGGTAVAAGVVPLAKRALVADNAQKLQGRTASALTAQAASRAKPTSVAEFVSMKEGPWTLDPDDGDEFSVTCDRGTKVVSGGIDDPSGFALSLNGAPTSDGTTWRTLVYVSDEAPAPQSGKLYAICVK